MKKRKISVKMLAGILPVMILAMVLMTVVSVETSKKIIDGQINDHMEAELERQINRIDLSVQKVKTTAQSLADTISATYKNDSIEAYTTLLTSLIKDEDFILGSGIWFAPNVYDPASEYMGPYVYKNGNDIDLTMDYSNANYDYFSQDYYTTVKEKGELIITDPYYDETSDIVMATCSCPMYDSENTFIGCVTVDIKLDSINELVQSIKVGNSGKAMLLSADGTYLSNEDNDKIADSVSIKNDKDFAKAGDKMLKDDHGEFTENVGTKKNDFYVSTLESTGWKLCIMVGHEELYKDITNLTIQLTILCTIAVILVAAVILWQVLSISKQLAKVSVFSSFIAEGDFTVDMLEVKSNDELGQMGEALNRMYEKNKGVIIDIIRHSKSVDESSKNLLKSSEQLSSEFAKIESYMAEVNEDMVSASAATQQVNASTEEVNASVNILTGKTEESKTTTVEIRNHAREIKEHSQSSFENATTLAAQYEEKLAKSIAESKIVENIGELAEVISNIADQINLLSLNASIEAARAGEAGRGFAVVASEIGHLANETTDAVSQISNTITEVKAAFSALSGDSQMLLKFIQDTVTPDYNEFVNVAKQYQHDSDAIEELVRSVAEQSETIRITMEEVSLAIQNIAESTQKTADNSGKIMDSVDGVANVVNDVADMSKQSSIISGELDDVVGNFKVK